MKVTDALLRERNFVYDALDRLNKVEALGPDPEEITELADDAAGNVMKVTDRPKDQGTMLRAKESRPGKRAADYGCHAFGDDKEPGNAGSFGNASTFTEREALQLLYYRARYYLPRTGRFLTRIRSILRGISYRNGISSSATTLVSLSIGLMAGPAVSL